MRDPFTNDDDELNMTLSKALNQIDDPLNDLENEMTEEIKEVKKVTKKTKAPVETKAKASKKAAKEAPATTREIPDGYIGLAGLAEELGMQPATLRRRLRTMEGVTKPEGSFGWMWKENSKDLKDLRKALSA